MTKREKMLPHKVLVSLQVECDVAAPDALAIIKNLQIEHVLKSNKKIHDMRFLLIKNQTEPLTQEEIDEAFERRRQKAIVEGE